MTIRDATSILFDRAKKILLLWLAILFVLGAGCSGSNNGTILITTSSERAREYFRIGRDLYEKLRPLEARHYYKEAIALDSNFALAYLYLALTESITDDRFRLLDKAASFVESVSEGEKLMILADLAESTGDRIKEREYYQRVVALYPNDERAHNLLANHYLSVQEYKRAVAEYINANKIDPEFSPAYNGLGYAYSYLGEIAAAEKAFLKYIELIPNDPNPCDSYAELLFRTGRFSESLVYYHKALRKNPYFLNAYESMASVYNYLGQYDEARAELETLLDRARTLAHQRMAYFAMAVSYADEGNPDSALAQISKSYTLAKQAQDVLAMAEDLENMGHILLECGKSDKALRKYKQATKLVGQSSLAPVIKEAAEQTYFYHATRVAIRQGYLVTARRHFAKYRNLTATAIDPIRVKWSHELAGAIALAEREYETALTELQSADRQDPCNLLRLAQAYHGLGNPEKAHEINQEFAVFYADNDLHYALIRGKTRENLAVRESD
jgi:tetratricopeptide (TPR) repeat protein